MSQQYPAVYRPDQVGKALRANEKAAVDAGLKAGWTPATRDKTKVCLVPIDMQVDFCHEDGTLPVPGALDDVRNVVQLIYTQGHKITTIAPTMDDHVPLMIFFPPWWVDKDGRHPEPYTIITVDDVKRGLWRAVTMSGWSHQYVIELAQGRKYDLMIWPFHCLGGSAGFSIVPALYEAVMYHAAARYSQPVFLRKGRIPQTEHYSPLRPEIEVPGVPGGGLNTDFLNLLASHDKILIVGEAKSHCVLAAMETLVEYFGANEPDVLRRIFFLTDCTSSVQHPAVDFEAIANKRLTEMQRNHGIQLVKSTEISL